MDENPWKGEDTRQVKLVAGATEAILYVLLFGAVLWVCVPSMLWLFFTFFNAFQ